MIWETRAIAGFAVRAGWKGEDVTTATAIAIATSSGDDQWSWSPAPAHEVDRVGLWGLDRHLFDLDRVGNMTDPANNARLAYGLWQGFSRSWEWAAVDVDRIPYYVTELARIAARNPDLAPAVSTVRLPAQLASVSLDRQRAARTAIETVRIAARSIIQRATGV